VADAALHEEEDDALGGRSVEGALGEERIVGGGGGVAAEEPGESEVAEAAGAEAEGVSAGEWRWGLA